jgi:hypothetical protein
LGIILDMVNEIKNVIPAMSDTKAVRWSITSGVIIAFVGFFILTIFCGSDKLTGWQSVVLVLMYISTTFMVWV